MATEQALKIAKAPQTATTLREQLGWCGSITWAISMMWGYDVFFQNETFFSQGSLYGTGFMLFLAASVAVFSYRFGRDPNGLAKIAFYTTPFAIIASIIFVFLPKPLSVALYLLAPVFMAPGFTRRVYGIIATAPPGKTITHYAIGWAGAFTIYAVWVAIKAPKEFAFLFPAFLAVLVWTGIRRGLPVRDEAPITKKSMFSKRSLPVFLLTLSVLFWLVLMWEIFLLNLSAGGDLSSNTISAVNSLMTWIPVSIGIMLFAVISDKGYDRPGFMISIGLFLISVLIVLLTDKGNKEIMLPLALAIVFGGMYTEYFSCTFPIYFFENYNRPVFAAVSGCIVFLVRQGIVWQKSVFIPRVFMELGTPLYVSAAISAVVFIVLVFFLFEIHRERTLTASLYALLHGNASAEVSAGDAAEKLFTGEERDVALLLIEGKMRSEITRSLHLTSEEADKRMDAIRAKISQMGDPDPIIAAAITAYKLSPREKDVLRHLRREMTYTEIAETLFLSEATVKVHVHNILKKMKISSRKDIEALLAAKEL